jgi:hypothetical protein
MLNLRRRLRKLERKQLGTAVESEATQHLRMRLENARLRCGSPPASPEYLAGLRGMTIVQILHSHRQKSAEEAELSDLKPDGP